MSQGARQEVGNYLADLKLMFLKPKDYHCFHIIPLL